MGVYSLRQVFAEKLGKVKASWIVYYTVSGRLGFLGLGRI